MYQINPVYRVPMRNWNGKNENLVDNCTTLFIAYLWGIETNFCWSKHFKPPTSLSRTYEELKPMFEVQFENDRKGLSRTYEELKQEKI